MKGYSATDIFSHAEQAILRRVTHMVEEIDTHALGDTVGPFTGHGSRDQIRCHELARAVAHHIGNETSKHVDDFLVHDGKYGAVDHSWIEWTYNHSWIEWTYNRTRILDVYCVGRLPMVQLIAVDGLLLEHRELYRKGPNRTDMRTVVVEYLLKLWKERCL